jgi:Xaa-Pro aminopeptidase
MAEQRYGEYFIHRTGHGIGLTTHEPPTWSRARRARWSQHVLLDRARHLPPGRFGVRIEDIVTVTDDGAGA